MMKKIIVLITLFSCVFLFNQANADNTFDPKGKSNTTDSSSSKYYNNNISENTLFKPADIESLQKAKLVNSDGSLTPEGMKASNQTDSKCGNECYKSLMEKGNSINSSNAGGEVCADGNCLDKPNFMVDTSLFSIGGNDLKKETGKQTINIVLGTIIQKLMIVLGTLSFAIITIGGYFMVTSHGDDSLLSKGKNVVKGGIISLVVALSSYYIVNMISYILYK